MLMMLMLCCGERNTHYVSLARSIHSKFPAQTEFLEPGFYNNSYLDGERPRIKNSPDAQQDHDGEPDPLLILLEGPAVQRDGNGEDDEVEDDVGGDVRGVGAGDLVGHLGPEPVAPRRRRPVPEARERHAGHDGDGRERDAPDRRHDDEEPAHLARGRVVVEEAEVLRQEAELHQCRRDGVGE